MKQLLKKVLQNKVFHRLIHAVPFQYPKEKLDRFNRFLAQVKVSGPEGCFAVLQPFEQKIHLKQESQVPFGLLQFLPITLINPPEAWDKYDQKLFVFDTRGKIQVEYQFGIHFNPTSLCQYALSLYDTYLQTKSEELKALFLKQIGFLLEESETTETEFRMPYRYDFFDMVKGPWLSALAQAQAGSVLLRAFVLTGDISYLEQARKAFRVINAKNGLDIMLNGYRWAEEYPTEKPSCVINGLAWVIISLLEGMQFFPKDPEMEQQVSDYIETYKAHIDTYDLGKGMIRYSMMNEQLVNNNYLGFQCLQMLQIFYYTKDVFFYNRHIKWQDNFDHEEFVSAYLPFNILNRRLRNISKGM
jgi:hypothetical protein